MKGFQIVYTVKLFGLNRNGGIIRADKSGDKQMVYDWQMSYNLDSDKYYPLQMGLMSSSITNTSQRKMLVTKVVLKFDWMRTRYYYKDCNIEIAAGAKVNLPTVLFKVTLEASTGTHLYKAGVVYKLLTESGWEDKGLGYVAHGRHVMLTEAPKRDFEVFVSHSNSPEDAQLLEKTIQSFNRCGITTYVAERSPQPGYPLWQKIEAAIRRADAILILWTEKGSQSGDIREEIGIAIGAKRTKRIIPLVQSDLSTRGSVIGLEHIPLDIDNPLEALSIAISRAIEWADKKEQGKPKIEWVAGAIPPKPPP